MEKLSPDELFSVAIELDLPDLLRLCKTSKKINEKLCKRDYIWLKLLNRDFSYYPKLINNSKDLYILLWNLRDFKNQLNLEEDIYTLYFSKNLDLSDRKLTKLPSSIRFLTNLEELYIKNNQLEKLPNYLPNSLKELYIYDNQLKELPNNLPNSLQTLYVQRNQLEKLPDNLPNFLKILFLEDNQLKELPNNLPNSLQKIFVGYNQLKKLPDSLPNSLEKIFVEKNQLEKLPNYLPNSLKELNLKYNQLKEDEINRIKKSYPRLIIYN